MVIILHLYQTKRVKQEKEQQKLRMKKYRDAFLLMLAENTEIDARTRWRDAVEVLKDDQRFKNLDDSREREDLFRDFILELEKKEKEDKRKQREVALTFFTKILHEKMGGGNIIGQANLRKLVWAEAKKDFVDVICRPELRDLEDSDLRRCFQDFVSECEESHRREERRRKEDFQRLIDDKQVQLDLLISNFARDGVVIADSRWKDFSVSPSLTTSDVYKDLQGAYQQHFTSSAGAEKDPSSISSSTSAAVLNCCREVFERVLLKVQEDYRADKRLLREVFQLAKVKISHDGSVQQLVDATRQLIGLDKTGIREDGEEDDYSSGPLTKQMAQQLKKVMTSRPNSVKIVFEDFLDKVKSEYLEEMRSVRKQEEKFRSLLQDTFYLSEHINTSWEDAKKLLQKRSAFDAVSSKSDRKRLFSDYMDELSRKMESKTKSMMSQHLLSSDLEVAANNNNSSDDGEEDSSSKVEAGEVSEKTISSGHHHKASSSSKKSKKDKKHKKVSNYTALSLTTHYLLFSTKGIEVSRLLCLPPRSRPTCCRRRREIEIEMLPSIRGRDLSHRRRDCNLS